MTVRGPAPRGLSELHLWLAAGEGLARGLTPLCLVDVLRRDDWEQRAQGRPAMLLVETSGEWGGSERELDGLLEHCEDAGVPALLWVTTSPLSDDWLDRCGRFRRVFTCDRDQLPALEAAGAENPSTLWPGTALDRAVPSEAERTDDVLWLGGWRQEWPAPWRERLASVLRGAARRGLRILQASTIEGLPPDLARLVDGAVSDVGYDAALRRAKVVIGADPRHGSARLAPPVVFDAAAAGAAVITPHDFLSLHDFAVGGTPSAVWRNLVPTVHDGDITVEEIDQLLADEVLHGEVVDHLARIVANNHTYAHRLATLAAEVGCRLVPDALDPAPA